VTIDFPRVINLSGIFVVLQKFSDLFLTFLLITGLPSLASIHSLLHSFNPLYMRCEIISILLVCSFITSLTWAAPIRKRADIQNDLFHNLSENISSQFQQALQPKLRQFSINIRRNVFAGLLPYDNEFVVAFSKQSGLELQISRTILSTWATEESHMRQAIFDALTNNFHQESEAIEHIDDAVRVARQALVDKIGGI
jgi:hypothetical protein